MSERSTSIFPTKFQLAIKARFMMTWNFSIVAKVSIIRTFVSGTIAMLAHEPYLTATSELNWATIRWLHLDASLLTAITRLRLGRSPPDNSQAEQNGYL